jgi:hypothetical protein
MLAVAVGVVTGALCSLLNIMALCIVSSSQPSPVLLKTCKLPRDVTGNLVPLIVAKVLSLLAIYLVPCVTMVTANIIMSRNVNRKANQSIRRSNNKSQRRNRTKVISGLLVFSSIFMVCCMSKPVFELYLAIRIHVDVPLEDRETKGMLLDAITWNLTTLAYVINTVLGIRYAK